MLRIRDIYPGSRIRIFSIPDPQHKILVPILTHKIVSKLSDPDFLPIPDPRSRGQNGTGSRIRIRNTGKKTGHEFGIGSGETLDPSRNSG